MSDKKMGRPVIGNPKTIDIKVRIDEETNQKLLKFCKEHGITRAESIRQAILNMVKNRTVATDQSLQPLHHNQPLKRLINLFYHI